MMTYDKDKDQGILEEKKEIGPNESFWISKNREEVY